MIRKMRRVRGSAVRLPSLLLLLLHRRDEAEGSSVVGRRRRRPGGLKTVVWQWRRQSRRVVSSRSQHRRQTRARAGKGLQRCGVVLQASRFILRRQAVFLRCKQRLQRLWVQRMRVIIALREHEQRCRLGSEEASRELSGRQGIH